MSVQQCPWCALWWGNHAPDCPARPRTYRKTSPVWKKFVASAVNASCAALIAAPFALLYGFDAWRIAVLVACFVGGVCFRTRCIGCMVVGTWPNRPASLQYTALYTLGLSTCFYWVAVPGDLLALNLTMQALCLRRTGTTVHGWLSGYYTVQGTRGPGWVAA